MSISAAQGKLGDLNVLVDHIHQHAEIDDIIRETKQLRAVNDTREQETEVVFSERKLKESMVKAVQAELDAEFSKLELMVNKMVLLSSIYLNRKF